MEILNQLLIVCPLVFFAGLVDSMAGGGGIITLPAYYIAGVPPHMALGTNKFVSTFGTSVAAFKFIKYKKVHIRSALIAAVAALIGSTAGARLALVLSEAFLQYVLIISIPFLAVFILRNKQFNKNTEEKPLLPEKKLLLLSALSGLVIGWYDGFFGPGTGTFLILIFNTIIGFDLLTASGNAKIVNLASNLAALFTFLFSGSIIFGLGIPAIAFAIAGNYLGSSLALKKGAKAIKPAFVFVLALLLIKIIYDVCF